MGPAHQGSADVISGALFVAIAEGAMAIVGLAVGRWRAGAAYRAAKLQAKIEYTDRWRAEVQLKPIAQRGRRRRWAENMAIARATAQVAPHCTALEDEVRRRVALAIDQALAERRGRR